MIAHRVVLALLAVTLCAGTPLLAVSQEEWSLPTKKWAKGPVKWILTEEEEKSFKKLKTDSERADFIKEFWAKRDPTSDTPQNEFAEHFWERVEEAETRFVQTTDSGALSERGRVFILFGMPTKVPPPGKNLEWIYEEHADISPPSFTVLFRAAGAGNYLLLGKKEVEGIIAGNEFVLGLGPKAKEVYAPPPMVAEGLPSAADYEAEIMESEEAKLLDAALESGTVPTDIPLQIRTDFYVATKGDSFAAVTVGVPRDKAPRSDLVGFARFIPDTEQTPPVTLASEDSFSSAEAENAQLSSRLFLYQGGTGLHPGRYTLLVGMRDPDSGKVGMLKQPMEVPSFVGGGLSLSTVALARRLEPLSSPPIMTPGKKPAFILGSFRIVPSLEGVFHQGSEVAVYFQIYNASPDPTTGRSNLTIQYDFLLKQEGEYRPVADPYIQRDRSSQVEAFSFPLVKPTDTQKGWIEGEYKLRIQVTDEVAQSSVSEEVLFKVVP